MGVSFPSISPGLSNTEKETTSFKRGGRGHTRETLRMKRNSWDNKSRKTEIWDGEDGLQLALLGGQGPCSDELALNGEWKSKTGWAKS